MPTLADQIAVVTGASSGIGKAIAVALAEQRATLCLVGRRVEILATIAEQARVTTARALYHRTDLTVDQDIKALAALLQRDFGHVDVLVHGAGLCARGTMDSACVDDLDWQYRTNVRAPYLLTQAVLPLLRVRQGQVVFLNSSAGLTAKAEVGQYAATKHALKAFADSFRDEVNADGIRVLSVFLGRTATPMQAAVHKMEQRAYHAELLIQPEDVAAMVLSAVRLPRTAEVTEIHIRPLIKSY